MRSKGNPLTPNLSCLQGDTFLSFRLVIFFPRADLQVSLSRTITNSVDSRWLWFVTYIFLKQIVFELAVMLSFWDIILACMKRPKIC